MPGEVLANGAMELNWHPASRLMEVRYTSGAQLVRQDGEFLVNALTGWIGTAGEPFAVLADGTGLSSTNADYRASASRFFRQHKDTVCIALTHLGPVIQVVVEMFRLGTGIQLKAFPAEAAARAWLRTKGIAA